MFDNRFFRTNATSAGEDARMERATIAQMVSLAMELIVLTSMNVNKEGLKFEKNYSIISFNFIIKYSILLI